jgi:parallel beta-helix repeat protein
MREALNLAHEGKQNMAMKPLPHALLLIAVFSCGASAAAVRHVDPEHPMTQDAGDGNAMRPYKTLNYAMRQIKPGDTLNIAAGTYREALIFPETDWSGGATLIQPASGDVVIKGTDLVTGWERIGDGLHVKRQWKTNSQQVFIDGAPLKQIGGAILGGYPEKQGHPMAKLHSGQGGIWPGRVTGGIEQMTSDSFFYDAATQSLYVKTSFASLDGRAVEVSVRPYLAIGKKLRNVTLRKLRFQHANTTAVSQSGAISLAGDQLVIDSIEVTYVDGNGLDITGDGNIIKDSRANYCGQVGMKVRGRNNRLIGNETSFNNLRGFNKWWEAGGAKFVGGGGLRDSEVSGHRAIGNNGDGIWFDWMNSNNRVHGNVSAYNAGFGIHYEASQKGHVYNNYVFGNRQRGIYLPHSADSLVAHNLVVANGMEGIVVIDEGRSKNKPELRPRTNRLHGNIVAWNGKAAIVLPLGLLENMSDYNLFVDDREPPAFSLGWGSRASPVRKGLKAWQMASGQDGNSWSETQEMPKALRDALAARSPSPDWSPVMSLASRFTVRAVPGGVARADLKPGPAQ